MESRIKSWVDAHKNELGIADYQLVNMTSGASNFVYHIKGERDLIFRTNKPPSIDKLAHEKRMLEFLASQDIENVPRVVLYEKDSSLDQPVLITSFVGEKVLDMTLTTERQRDNLAKFLAKIHQIPIRTFDEFFGMSTFVNDSLLEYTEVQFDKYAKGPYNHYLSLVSVPNKRIIVFYKKQQELLEEFRTADFRAARSIVHGDLGNNARNTSDAVYVVDWELGKVGCGLMEIIHFFNLQDVPEQEQVLFVKAYRKYNSLPDFERIMPLVKKFLLFNNMIWAAKRVEQERKIKGHDIEKYKKLLAKRLLLLEEVYQK